MKAELPQLPVIQNCFWSAVKDKLMQEYHKDYRYHPDFRFTMFCQTWGSTALGFDGFGGSAMTDAYTTVVNEINSGWYGVFFGEELAYLIKEPNEIFFEDMHKFQMKPVSGKSAYK